MPYKALPVILFFLAVIIVFVAVFLVVRGRPKWRAPKWGRNRGRLLKRAAAIYALEVPASVLARTDALLKEKGVVLDERQRRYMVQGFKDYLLAVLVSRQGSMPHWRTSVAMTSDTVDMLWHAWLEEPGYTATFSQLLGFPLSHLPEIPELVAPHRGPGKIDFMRSRPQGKAVATYYTLKAALSLVGRKAHASALYQLDTRVKNPDGFYYTAAIMLALDNADVRVAAPMAAVGGMSAMSVYAGSACQDVALRKRSRDDSSGCSSCSSGCSSCSSGGGCSSGSGGDIGSGSDSSGSSCSSGSGCGSSCGSSCGGGGGGD